MYPSFCLHNLSIHLRTDTQIRFRRDAHPSPAPAEFNARPCKAVRLPRNQHYVLQSTAAATMYARDPPKDCACFFGAPVTNSNFVIHDACQKFARDCGARTDFDKCLACQNERIARQGRRKRHLRKRLHATAKQDNSRTTTPETRITMARRRKHATFTTLLLRSRTTRNLAKATICAQSQRTQHVASQTDHTCSAPTVRQLSPPLNSGGHLRTLSNACGRSDASREHTDPQTLSITGTLLLRIRAKSDPLHQ